MKKIICSMLSIVVVISCLAACGSSKEVTSVVDDVEVTTEVPETNVQVSSEEDVVVEAIQKERTSTSRFEISYDNSFTFSLADYWIKNDEAEIVAYYTKFNNETAIVSVGTLGNKYVSLSGFETIFTEGAKDSFTEYTITTVSGLDVEGVECIGVDEEGKKWLEFGFCINNSSYVISVLWAGDSASYSYNSEFFDIISSITPIEKASNTFSSTITFDGFEITFADYYYFDYVDNRFSDYNGNAVVVIPCTVHNISGETSSINMFYMTYFGSQGTELDGISAYFDNSIEWAGDLRNGASYETAFYILYDGDGTYYINLDNWDEEVEASFDIAY